MKVYFKQQGKLGCYNVVLFGDETHEDIILDVQEALIASGDGWDEKTPVLAVIDGGKNGI